MANFTATDVVSVHERVEDATAALETALEAVVNTSIIRTCEVLKIGGERYAAILIYTAAVA